MNYKPKTAHLEIHQYKPGQSGNKSGRPKSSVTILKELGFTKPVIATMTAEIAFMSYPEVYQLAESRTEPILRRIIAEAFKSAAYDGEYRFIEPYMKILFGRTVPYIPEPPKDNNQTQDSTLSE
jgi:Family of unknown function (DUF5681)